MTESASRIPGIDDGTTSTGVSSTPVTRETPLDPATYAELEEIAARYPQARSGLLPMLHLVQSVEGRVTSRGIEACAAILGISAAEVSGVSTFYTMYKRRPVGDFHVGVCTNTLCAIMGGDLIFERLKDHLDVGNDETTEDGKVTLEHIADDADGVGIATQYEWHQSQRTTGVIGRWHQGRRQARITRAEGNDATAGRILR